MLRKLFGLHPMPLETWMFGISHCVSGNQPRVVQTVAGGWQVSLLDPENG